MDDWPSGKFGCGTTTPCLPGDSLVSIRTCSVRVHSWTVLLLLCGLLFFYRLADRDLWNSHEARAGMDAQTILDDGQWGLPRLYDGRPELQKPPLYYWMVALLARVRGVPVDAWAVRLPAALSALACVLLVYGLGRKLGRPVAGLAAALILATSLHFTWLARVGRIDMPLTLAISLALTGFYLARTQEKRASQRAWLLLAYVVMAAGLLLKGPIAVVLPAAVVIVYLLVEQELPPWRGKAWLRLPHQLGLWWGGPLVLLLVVPWYGWANQATEGEFLRVFLWHHNVERGLGGSETLRAHPWWFYGPQFLFDTLPWSLLLPFAVWRLVKRGGWREDSAARLGLIWLLTTLALLSCFRFKRADYLLPAYPGAALFLGCVAERCYHTSKAPRRWLVGFSLVVGACLVGWLIHVEWILPRQEAQREYRRFAEEIRRLAPAPEPIVFFRTEAHPLAFRVGRPMQVKVWWHELEAWTAQPGVHYVVMPRAVAAQSRSELPSGRLEEVLGNEVLAGGSHEKPLVLLRTVPLTSE